jgi:hypothetical protein
MASADGSKNVPPEELIDEIKDLVLQLRGFVAVNVDSIVVTPIFTPSTKLPPQTGSGGGGGPQPPPPPPPPGGGPPPPEPKMPLNPIGGFGSLKPKPKKPIFVVSRHVGKAAATTTDTAKKKPAGGQGYGIDLSNALQLKKNTGKEGVIEKGLIQDASKKELIESVIGGIRKRKPAPVVDIAALMGGGTAPKKGGNLVIFKPKVIDDYQQTISSVRRVYNDEVVPKERRETYEKDQVKKTNSALIVFKQNKAEGEKAISTLEELIREANEQTDIDRLTKLLEEVQADVLELDTQIGEKQEELRTQTEKLEQLTLELREAQFMFFPFRVYAAMVTAAQASRGLKSLEQKIEKNSQMIETLTEKIDQKTKEQQKIVAQITKKKGSQEKLGTITVIGNDDGTPKTTDNDQTKAQDLQNEIDDLIDKQMELDREVARIKGETATLSAELKQARKDLADTGDKKKDEIKTWRGMEEELERWLKDFLTPVPSLRDLVEKLRTIGERELDRLQRNDLNASAKMLEIFASAFLQETETGQEIEIGLNKRVADIIEKLDRLKDVIQLSAIEVGRGGGGAPKVPPKVPPKVVPKVPPKVVPKVPPKVVPKVPPKVAPKVAPKVPVPKVDLNDNAAGDEEEGTASGLYSRSKFWLYDHEDLNNFTKEEFASFRRDAHNPPPRPLFSQARAFYGRPTLPFEPKEKKPLRYEESKAWYYDHEDLERLSEEDLQKFRNDIATTPKPPPYSRPFVDHPSRVVLEKEPIVYLPYLREQFWNYDHLDVAEFSPQDMERYKEDGRTGNVPPRVKRQSYPFKQ